MALTPGVRLVVLGAPTAPIDDDAGAVVTALAAAGVGLESRTVVDEDEIALERSLTPAAPLTIIITGPTDIARRVLARATGTRLALNDRMLAALDTTWELASLRGDVSSLRGEISSIRGQESSLRGEISSLRGEVSSMRGRASSALGEESSLRGQISSIQGHVSSLRGEISSELGAISSLSADRYGADATERARITTSVAKHDAAIDRLEREIRDYDAAAKIAAVEKEIRALDTSGKVAAIDAEIRAFDLDRKVAAIERQIAALDVDGKTAAIDKQIAALDAERRARQLEERRDEEIKRLDAAMAAIR